MKTAAEIAEAWAGWTEGMAAFSRMLDQRGVEYLTFSKVACLDFCPQRYLLEYVQRIPLDPEPPYFIRGRVFHEAAAFLHRVRQQGHGVSLDSVLPESLQEVPQSDRTYIRNAMELMRRQVPANVEVVAVEEGFVLDLGPDLPPCLGIVDLVERQGGTYTVIDHKGGKGFWDNDPLQLLLYRRHVQRTYGARRCRCYFDQYRWVNNLDRIRGPAWQRTAAVFAKSAWRDALRRLAKAHAKMNDIAQTGKASAPGDCRLCPYRPHCNKASF